MKRDIRIDLIKFIAIVSVIGLHFFLNNNFSNELMINHKYYLYLLINNIFLVCVPLFIISTGYLMCNKKEFNIDYISKLFKRIIVPYIIIGFICILFRLYYVHDIGTFISIILEIFNFSSCPYAWYIGMYIGLYLFIPFINKCLDNLNKKDLIILLILLFIFGPLGSILRIIYHGTHYLLITSYFYSFWILNYYIIGYYIKKYGISIKLKYILLLILLIPIISLGNYLLDILFYNKYYYSGDLNFWGGIIPYIGSVLVFILIINMKIDIKNKIVYKFIVSTSSYTLNIYLFSYIYDQLIYKLFPLGVSNSIMYMPLIVLIVFMLSYNSSLIIDYLFYKLLRFMKINNN